MKIAIIFPPVFDPSMPYLAPYQLKSYLDKYRPLCETNVYDLNIRFFNSVIKNPYLDFDHNINKISSYDAIVDSENKITRALADWSKLHNINITRQTADYRFETSTPSGFSSFLKSESSFKKVIEELLYSNIVIERYDLYCISVTSYEQLLPALVMAKALKLQKKGNYVCFGGNIISRIYRGLLKSNLLSHVDYLIIKEGELPLLNLVDRLSNIRFEVLTNCLIETSSGKIVDSTGYPAILDVDRIPTVNFNEDELNLYFSPEPVLPISLTRGCSWRKCLYCGIHTAWCSAYRTRSIGNLVEEIDHHVKNYSTNKFRLIDESPAIGDLLLLSEFLINKGSDIRVEAYLNLSKSLNDEYISIILYQAGFRQFFFGIESLNHELLKEIGKDINNPNYYSNILRNLHKNGISNYSFFMVGLPNDTLENENQLEDFLITNRDLDTIAISSFIALSNSPMYSDEKFKNKYGLKFIPRGDLTTRCDYTINNASINEIVNNRARNITNRIFEERKDLYLSSNIPYEARFYLINKFGNNYFKDIALMVNFETITKNLSQELDGRLNGLK